MSQSQQYKAFITEEWKAGRLTRPLDALQHLRRDPSGFLKKYPLSCMFDPQHTATTTAYIFNGGGGQRPGTVLKTHNMHATESFTIQGAPGQLGEGDAFQVYGVHTAAASPGLPVAWQTLNNLGPDIMLTAKLTGCTFVARPVAGTPGAVQVAHIQPAGQIDGVSLNVALNQPGQRAYGRLNYDIDIRSINVIGVRVGGRWQIYAQKLEKTNLTIRSVTKIFPV